MNIFEKISDRILNGQFSGAISGYQTETEQRIMDKINEGWEIEDPNEEYDDDDKKMSAAGTVADFFNHDETAAKKYFRSL